MNVKRRSMIVLLIAALLIAMLPMSASAASKKPGKVKITKFSVGTVSKKTNTAKVTVKWKKVSKATGYWVYEKTKYGEWKLLHKGGKNSIGVEITGVKAGDYYIKVRAVRKSGGKTYKGAFSKVKHKFIKSPLTAEKYSKIEPTLETILKGRLGDGDVSFSGNTMTYSYDLSDQCSLEAAINMKDTLDQIIDEYSDYYTETVKMAKAYSGISDIKLKYQYTHSGQVIVSRKFTAK